MRHDAEMAALDEAYSML